MLKAPPSPEYMACCSLSASPPACCSSYRHTGLKAHGLRTPCSSSSGPMHTHRSSSIALSVRCTSYGMLMASRSIEHKVALLELGILLLEIWHKTTLGARFRLENAPTAPYDRMARAVECPDDVDEPLKI